jgi:hypothetical protein
VMLGPGSAYLQQAPPTGVIVPSGSQPPPLVHMIQPQGGVLQTPPPPPPPGGQYAMWPSVSGAPVGEQAIDPRKGTIIQILKLASGLYIVVLRFADVFFFLLTFHEKLMSVQYKIYTVVTTNKLSQ